jgi:cell surface protein SprA
MYITDSNPVATRSKLGMKFMAILCFMGIQTFLLAQTDTSAKYKIAPPKVWETNKTSSNIDLKSPINTIWKYNAKTNRYDEYRTVGSSQYPTGNTLSVMEYVEQNSKEKKNEYFRGKSQNAMNADGRGKGSITDYLKGELNNPFTNKIFGEGAVDFQLSGSAMIRFGGNLNVNRNPSFSKRQQRYFIPIFDQQIQFAANGNIGQYVKLGINYDTEAAFEFDNQTNLGWKGKPDGLLKDVQVGNLALNLPTQLIKPANNLYGISTKMQFGKTTVQAVVSQNKGQSTESVLQGGAQLNEFRIGGDNYEQNRHYFLSQFFRNNYDRSLENMPVISSGVLINRVEVWVTNRGANVETPRNILAFMDLGEGVPYRNELIGIGPTAPSDNAANKLFYDITSDPSIATLGGSIDALNAKYNSFEQSLDYDILSNARMLTASDFSLNKQLGYISLNQPLNNDEILSVAFEYTYNDQVYTVGQFSRDINQQEQDLLFVKMLKPTTIRVKVPIWDLMMKNIYNLNTYSLSLEDFKFNIIYADDTSGADYNYIPRNDVQAFAGGRPLLQVFNLDRLNRQQEGKPDGVFDAIEGLTINTQYARIMFPVIEPFGDFMRDKFNGRSDLADYYAFDALYDSTKLLAQQDTRHNKFFLTGSYKSQNGAELFLGTTNLARGSVRVTANGRPLTEGFDYEVDYILGRVKIINQGLLQGGAEIRATADGQSFFNINQKTLIGTRIEHKFNKNVILGATALHMYERPLTSKTNFGEEPLLNTIVGTDFTFSGKSRFITKMVDKLPFLETKAVSTYNGYFEFAKLYPGNHRSQDKQRGISNLDDFENAELPNDYKTIQNWAMSSVPQKQPDLIVGPSNLFKPRWLDHSAKIAFYSIDPLFYRDNDMPDNIAADADNILSNPYMRQWDQRDLFPFRNFPAGTPTLLSTLDITFDPYKRGQYNFAVDPSVIDANGRLIEPKKSWGGLMRRVDLNDFEAANIDYIEIWMLDPMVDSSVTGEMYLNLGNISEDILPDRRKAFESGNPTDGDYSSTDTTQLGIIPTRQQINFAFDANPDNIRKQDVGLDGLDDAGEREFYDTLYLKPLEANFGTGSQVYRDAFNDPSNDNFLHYLEPEFDQAGANIIERYQRFQNVQGNSNPDQYGSGKYNGMPRSYSSTPNDEDINRDFTMNQSEDYFQYKINISPTEMQIGKNYITDIVEESILIRNGQRRAFKWYQLKIPIREYQKAVGNISDFKSIRFMRLFLTNFDKEVKIRIAYMNLVRADWRRYTNSLKQPGVVVPVDPNDGTLFSVSTVNKEENGNRSPIVYVEPPGVLRVQNLASLGTTVENEQALSLAVCNLKPGDSRAAFKTSEYDIRNYKRLQMFLHAEAPENPSINDNDVSAFIRFGTDLTNNYYEYEIPLKFTRGVFNNPQAAGVAEAIWRDENFIDLEFDKLINQKINRQNEAWPLTIPYIRAVEKGNVTVLGLPDLGNIRVFMIGVRNNSDVPQCFEIWANELRVKDIANGGGYAALANFQTNLADFGQLSMAGSVRTIGFGDVDKKLNQRSLNKTINFDIASNLELGKFFPQKMGVSLPLYIGYSENYIRPKFYPLNPDVELQLYLAQIMDSKERERVRKAAEDFSSLYSINLANIKFGIPKGKAAPWKISNFTGGYSYQNNYRRNQQIEENFVKTTKVSLAYAFSPKPLEWNPFKKIKNKKLAIIKDFNINFMPSSFNVQTQFNRLYAETQARNNNTFRQVNPRFYDKNFTNTRNYNLTWQLTKALNLTYNSVVNSRIQEPFGKIESQEQKDSIWNEVLNFGKMTDFQQQVNLSYTVPINKIPILNWININTSYNVSYKWMQAPPIQPTLGNTIQNASTFSVQPQFNFNKLYQKIPWLRDLNKKKTQPVRKPKTTESGENKGDEKENDKEPKPNYLKLGVGNFISMFKNAGFNYSRTEGTLLPGFKYTPDYFGQNMRNAMPGAKFILGIQEKDLRYKLAQLGALNNDPQLSTLFTKNFNETFTGNITVEPLKDFRIVFDLSKSTNINTQSTFKYNGTEYTDQGFSENGSFNATGWFFNTHFAKDANNGEQHPNPIFTQFEGNRYTIAQRYMNQDERVVAKGIDPITGYPLGYNKNNQDVLVSSFYAAYTGRDAGSSNLSAFPAIPLPGWNVNYTGLSKIAAIKEKFTNITIKHGYSGKYSVNGFTQNLKFDPNETFNPGKSFTPKYQIENVTISEGFFPLIGINITTKNNWTMGFDYKRQRTVRLIAGNFNVSEQRNNDFQMNVGYRVAGLTLPIRRNGRRLHLPNDFRFDLTVSVGDIVTVVRNIDQNNNRYSQGMRTVRISPNVSYQINDQFNMAFRYNRLALTPKVQNQFYTALTDFGLELRYTLN